MNAIPIILAGLVLLVAGAEVLVRSSAFLALRLGVPALVVGLTIVAFGTSAPEVVASVTAALMQSPGIAVGNIVGSNITNALLVAGAAALVAPIAVSSSALKRDGFTALLAAAAFWVLCWLQVLNAATGSALLLALVIYVVHSYRQEKRTAATGIGAASSKGAVRSESGLRLPALGHYEVPAAVVGSILGIVLLAFGGNLLVGAAVDLAGAIGVSETIIGLTIVAVGTSLPELATSMLAAARGQSEIAIGNVIGSNIFNVLGIGGLTALLSQGEVPARLVAVDFPVMLATTGLLVVFAATGLRVRRREGAVLVGVFALYLGSIALTQA